MSSLDEKVDFALRLMSNILDVGRLYGKAEAYQYMFNLLKKSHLKTSNPKLLLSTICLSLDSLSDVLERMKNFLEDTSPTMVEQVDILLKTISTLSDRIRLNIDKGDYEEAFDSIKKADKEIKEFWKENEATFRVYVEVSRRRLKDMFRKQEK